MLFLSSPYTLMLHHPSGFAKSAAVIQGSQRFHRSPPKIEAELRHEIPSTNRRCLHGLLATAWDLQEVVD